MHPKIELNDAELKRSDPWPSRRAHTALTGQTPTECEP